MVKKQPVAVDSIPLSSTYNGAKTYSRPNWWQKQTRKSKFLLAILLLILVGLALGLGLGLGLRKKQENDEGSSGDESGNDTDNTPDLSLTPIAATPSNNTRIYRPAVGTTFQIVLLNPIDVPENATSIVPNVEAFDIDMFTNPKTTIDTLHRLNKKVICYFSAGSYEPNRPDSGNFTSADMGDELKGWPGEKWLNLKSQNVRNIMARRMQLAASKGCDAVDPDNMDAYANRNGMSMTSQDSIDFMGFLSQLAASLNMGIGLKNAGKIIPQVLPGVQFAVNEQCVQFKECQTWAAYINASKPVFEIEYPSEVKAGVADDFCKTTGQAQGREGFTTVIKHMNLDGWVKYCDGLEATTPVITGSSPS